MHVSLDAARRRNRTVPARAANQWTGGCAGRGGRTSARRAAVLLQRRQVLRAGAETVRRSRFGHPPEHVAIRRRRATRRTGRRVQRLASAEASQFHIIQPQVVKKNNRSPGRRSVCSRCSLRCCSSVPPAPCTMHFGTPVVPEEYMTIQRRIERQAREGGRRAGLPEVLPGDGVRQRVERGCRARRRVRRPVAPPTAASAARRRSAASESMVLPP